MLYPISANILAPAEMEQHGDGYGGGHGDGNGYGDGLGGGYGDGSGSSDSKATVRTLADEIYAIPHQHR